MDNSGSGSEINQFKRSLKRYLEIHENEERVKVEVRSLKEEKDNLETYLLDFMERNQYQDKDIDVGNYKVKYSATKQTESVTKKLIYERLYQYFHEDENKAKELLEFIYQDRSSTTKTSIKLTPKKN